MGFGRNEASGDSGPSTSMGLQWFPSAAQPEIMRAAEKDKQYASFVYDACRDALLQILGEEYRDITQELVASHPPQLDMPYLLSITQDFLLLQKELVLELHPVAQYSQIQSSTRMEIPSSSASRTSMSVASRLKEKLNGL